MQTDAEEYPHRSDSRVQSGFYHVLQRGVRVIPAKLPPHCLIVGVRRHLKNHAPGSFHSPLEELIRRWIYYLDDQRIADFQISIALKYLPGVDVVRLLHVVSYEDPRAHDPRSAGYVADHRTRRFNCWTASAAKLPVGVRAPTTYQTVVRASALNGPTSSGVLIRPRMMVTV